MIVKSAIKYLLEASDAAVIVIVQAVLAAIGAYPLIFVNVIPTPATIQAALDAFISALQDAALGGPAQTAIKNGKRAELASLMRMLANYVTAIANGDMSIMLLSALPYQKPDRTTIGPLGKPVSPRLVLGVISGTFRAATAPVYGAGSYNWRVALASAPTVYVQSTTTMGGRASFNGFTAGETYNVAVQAVGTAGPSDWSEVGTAMIL